MRDIIAQHFGYEHMSDFNYVAKQKELLQQVNGRIESGQSTQFTLELKQELEIKISQAKTGAAPWEEKRWFSSLTTPMV